MERKLTKTQERILARMRELATTGEWVAIRGDTIRLTRTRKTHPANLGTGFGRWEQPEYDQHMFVTLMHSGMLLGDAPAPWVGRSDSTLPYWLAEAILDAEDPWDVLERRVALTQARKLERQAGRS